MGRRRPIYHWNTTALVYRLDMRTALLLCLFIMCHGESQGESALREAATLEGQVQQAANIIRANEIEGAGIQTWMVQARQAYERLAGDETRSREAYNLCLAQAQGEGKI